MTDFNEYTSVTEAIVTDLREKVAELQIERDEARAKRDRYAAELQSLRAALQQDLASYAESYLSPGDADYREFSELMVNNGLEGLKRTFTVTVRATYEFEVEVEATDEDAARDEVDNDITTYAEEHLYLGDSPDYYDVEVTEA